MSIYLLALGSGFGVVGSLWNWWQHIRGVVLQPPPFLIDIDGLLVIAVLTFADRRGQGRGAFVAGYLLFALVAIITSAPSV